MGPERLKPFTVPPHLKVEMLGRCPLFHGLPAAALWDLVPSASAYEARRRQVFFREGQEADACWVLVSGLAKVSQSTSSGREVILRLVAPGEVLGGLLAGSGPQSHSTAAMALEGSLVLAVLQPAFLRTLLSHPGLGRNAVRLVSERLRQMEEDHVRLATGKVEERLAETLVRLAERVGRPCPEGVRLGLSREDLAQMVGTNHFSVSRQLAQWESAGFLLSRREVVILVDGPGLLMATRAEGATESERRAV